MKLNYPQLESHLAKQLAPIYLVASDELLLTQEAVDLIRHAARKREYIEREVITVDSSAEWSKSLYASANNFSLLATRRIVELNMTASKPNAAASKLLQEYAAEPPQDTLLIIYTNKLDSKAQKSAWYTALDAHGVILHLWPIPPEQLPAWVKQRAKKIGLDMTQDAAALLAQHAEGNLLAAAQEIEKLSLLKQAGSITLETIEQAIGDNARFDIFQLVDSLLLGNRKRGLRILESLREEDVEPPVILWAFTREIRTLADIAAQQKQGHTLSSLFSKFRVWEKRQPCVRAFLQRHSQASCWNLLLLAAKIDRIVKGVEIGNAWNTLQDLALAVCGDAILQE